MAGSVLWALKRIALNRIHLAEPPMAPVDRGAALPEAYGAA